MLNLMDFNVVPGIAPVDTAATAISTQFVDVKTAHDINFLVSFGTVTVASADQPVTITVNAATVQAGTSAVAVPFTYRLSGAAAANSWGASTAATSAGYAPVGATATGKMVWITVDPAAIKSSAETDYRWVNLTVTPDAGASVCLVAAIPFLNPRYKQVTMVSAT